MFAIKVILFKDPKLLSEIKREVEMMRRLEHEHLVSLHEVYESAGSYGMLMDYVEGGELFERIIEKEYLEEKEAVEYLHQLIQGLQHMHSLNIVHLDIKPENILCVNATSNRIKLIDFGLARELKPGEVTRCALGTPDFVAPEAISFNEIKLQTDMWSTGVLTYVLLSGLMPFAGEDDSETLCNIANLDWEFDKESFEEISADARDFIQKLLTLSPDERMSSDEALQHPWMKANEDRAGKINTKRHRAFLARRRWMKSVNAVMAVTKLYRILNKSGNERSRSNSSLSQSGEGKSSQQEPRFLNVNDQGDGSSLVEKNSVAKSNVLKNDQNNNFSDSSSEKIPIKTYDVKPIVTTLGEKQNNAIAAIQNENVGSQTQSKNGNVIKRSHDVETRSNGTSTNESYSSKPVNVAFTSSNKSGERVVWKVFK